MSPDGIPKPGSGEKAVHESRLELLMRTNPNEPKLRPSLYGKYDKGLLHFGCAKVSHTEAARFGSRRIGYPRFPGFKLNHDFEYAADLRS
jgi:hypothetical protein